MSETIIIRKASLNDIEILRRFEQGVINAERPFDPTLKEEDIFYYDIEGMIQATNIELLVAILNDKLVGSGYARIEKVKIYFQHREKAYLGFMYTDPAHRGKGINKKIIDALKSWSLSQNVTEIRLDVYQDNTAAIKAYEKAGFTKHMVEMRIGIKNQ